MRINVNTHSINVNNTQCVHKIKLKISMVSLKWKKIEGESFTIKLWLRFKC